MTVKKASVTYIPNVGNVDDTISASYDEQVLVSKDFYIAPFLRCNWRLKDNLKADTTAAVKIIWHLGGCRNIDVENFVIKDSKDTKVTEKDTHHISNGGEYDFNYDVPSDMSSTTFTLTYIIKGTKFQYESDSYPIEGGKDSEDKEPDVPSGDTEAYELLMDSPAIAYEESTVELKANNTDLATGSIIAFTSTHGLNETATLKEENDNTKKS